ncbi:hypothetical protein Salat_2612700 [Sesamum alatum]|uniref:Uncharacterized protein n=1 Tax=Sesamum alatum TaxID=300844 RepID=A0AAE2CAL4_9LAMI|nr:hypothetical protein Salat_2612700 [Sesamum alatum]
MWSDGFYYQEQMFYNSRWTKEVEKTFVDSLADRFDLNVPARDVGWVEAPQHHEGQATFPAEGNAAIPTEGNDAVPAEENAGGPAKGDAALPADPVVTLSGECSACVPT